MDVKNKNWDQRKLNFLFLRWKLNTKILRKIKKKSSTNTEMQQILTSKLSKIQNPVFTHSLQQQLTNSQYLTKLLLL